jgi:thioredoxin reductase (NADPH)
MSDQPADLVVIGAGVAGLTAATLAARRGLKTICVEEQMFGGLVLNIGELDPAPAARPAQGAELSAGLMEEAAEAGVAYSNDAVTRLERAGSLYRLETAGDAMLTRAVVIATGARLKPLDVPGEQEFEHRGVAHCADCDAAFYAGRDAVVVGGGDSALQEALVLARYCQTVFVVHNDALPTARSHFVDEVAKRANIRLMPFATVKEIRGRAEVEAVVVRGAGGDSEITCAAVFPYIGLQPNTSFLSGQIKCDTGGFVITNDRLEASLDGLYAIGAVRAGFGGSLDDAFAEGERVVEALLSKDHGGDL